MSQAIATTRPVSSLATPDPSLPVGASFDEMMQLASTIHKSGMFGHKNPESVFTAMLKGRELGVPATVALSMIHVIEGKPTASAELMLALVERDYGRGAMYIDLEECTQERAVVKYRDPQTHAYRSFEYTLEMATTAGLVNGNTWKKYPGNMLRWRAVSTVAKAVYPASVGGLYTPEEMGADIAFDDEGHVIDITPPARQLRDAGNSQEATPRQMKYLFAMAREKGWHDDDVHGCAHEMFGIDSLSELSRRTISDLIERVQRGPRWVDPRHSSMELDAVIDATAREVPSNNDPDIDPDTGEILDEPDGCWGLDGSFLPPRVSGDPAHDMAVVIDAAATAPSARGLKEAWQFAESIGLASDAEVVGAFTARKREKGWGTPGNGSTGGK